MQNIQDPRSLAHSGATTPQHFVRSYMEAHAPELEALLAGSPTGGIQLARRSAELMDALLRVLYRAAVDRLEPAVPVVIAAVGGYGRRLLGWKSDLDVRLLTSARPEQLERLAEAILYPLWDAGVSVGHQVVTLDSLLEDARSDLPTATALLDFRPLVGDVELAHALNERMYEEVFAPRERGAFLERLQAEVHGRRARMSDPAYLLEPDVKYGEGGLRDLDCALWAAAARWKIGEPAELCRSGLLSVPELEATQRALELMWSIRNRLHRDAGRRSDRLTFVEQERIAAELGYAERAGVSSDTHDPTAVEAMAASFMSDYHRHARSLAAVSERLLMRALPHAGAHAVPGPVIPPGLCRFGETLGLVDSARLEHEPELALQLIAAAIEHQLPVNAPARDAIQRACAAPSWQQALRASPRAAALFVSLVGETRPARFRGESILAELLELGLLTALIPEFAPVVSKAHHDTYHVYTVDVHSIYAVDYLRALARGDKDCECSMASGLAQRVEHGVELYLAVLLHDIGKATSGRGHAQRGADMARGILRRLQLSAQAIEQICQLIREHLTMYNVAMHRDLADPQAIASFGRLVGTQAQLAQLYLLTVADVCTTSPTSMTEWKSLMLDELFLATEAWLDGRTSSSPDAEIERWSRHALAAQEAGVDSVHVACVPRRGGAISELCVITPFAAGLTGLSIVAEDRPGLLALIAAALAANRFEVCAAEIHTRKRLDGTTQGVDRFWVRSPSADPARLAARITGLEQDLMRLLRGEISARALLEARKPSCWSAPLVPEVPARVNIDHDASQNFTVIEVLAKDRPGLLFTLTETLHELGLTIALAKISTEGARATDAFYVTERTGEKLERGARAVCVEARLLSALGSEPTLPREPTPAGAERGSFQA